MSDERTPERPATYVECENCGHGYRWIPASVEQHLRHLQAENERLTRRCEVYAAGITAIATYKGEDGLGYETPRHIAQQTINRVDLDASESGSPQGEANG